MKKPKSNFLVILEDDVHLTIIYLSNIILPNYMSGFSTSEEYCSLCGKITFHMNGYYQDIEIIKLKN